MGLRKYDWECDHCGDIQDPLVMVDAVENKKTGRWETPIPPRQMRLHCHECNCEMSHTRLISAPAQYTYDKPYHAPVYGGKFDTEGFRKPPPMPRLPDGCDFDQARDILKSKEYQEKKAKNWDVIQQNKAKQARSKAMRKHPTMDIRNTPLPGDPSLKG
jgi:hypothetical protein